jgi:hypothetical protein
VDRERGREGKRRAEKELESPLERKESMAFFRYYARKRETRGTRVGDRYEEYVQSLMAAERALERQREPMVEWSL